MCLVAMLQNFHSLEGGIVCSKNKELIEQIKYLRNFGIKNEEEIIGLGINAKLNELQAAVGLEVLSLVDEEISKRKIVFSRYVDSFKGIDGLKTQNISENVKHNYQYFILRINKDKFGISRDAIYDSLRKKNIFVRKYFYPLCSDYPIYKDLPSSQNLLKTAHLVTKEVLALPIYGILEKEKQDEIIDIILNLRL